MKIIGKPLKARGKKTLANRDGFDSWEELKSALNLHHGDTLNDFKLTREALKGLNS